jgi:hypothetical protein
MESRLRQEDEIAARLSAAGTRAALDRGAPQPGWVVYDRIVVAALLAVQLFLYFFWTATQWPAVAGTWWSPIFSRSGPLVLPLMFGLQLVLIGAAVPLAWRDRERLVKSRPILLLAIIVAAGVLTIPLAYLAHFSQVKIWKDVAFLTGYLLAPIVMLLGATAARRFFFFFLSLGFATGFVGLIEAIHRAQLEHIAPGPFFNYMYRVYAGGQYTELLLLFGALAVYGSYRGAWRQPVHALLVVAYFYAALRMRMFWTRLYWIALGITLPLTLIYLPRKMLRSGLIVALILGVTFVIATPFVNVLAQQQDIGNRFTPENNVSLDFRAKESKLLAKKVLARPLTGWGPGGTISPNIPQEPLRNNTSSFFDGYLGVAYKFGLIVLALLIAAILLALWRMRVALTRPPNRFDAALIGGAAVYLIAVLVTSPAQDLFFSNFSAIPLALMLGIGLRLAQPTSAVEQVPKIAIAAG